MPDLVASVERLYRFHNCCEPTCSHYVQQSSFTEKLRREHFDGKVQQVPHSPSVTFQDNKIACSASLRYLEAIACSPHGLEIAWIFRVALDLFPDAAHVDIDRARR